MTMQIVEIESISIFFSQTFVSKVCTKKTLYLQQPLWLSWHVLNIHQKRLIIGANYMYSKMDRLESNKYSRKKSYYYVSDLFKMRLVGEIPRRVRSKSSNCLKWTILILIHSTFSTKFLQYTVFTCILWNGWYWFHTNLFGK